ncbi:MAG: flagellar basal body P-ring formation protein FlgA, partial [Phycisphaerae bacterium]|nr:flagellar basal body P-ring formation protein FlgA [Phycisphaerae bacterium]
QRSVPLFVNVRLVKDVLVAGRPLNVGTFVRPEDITKEQRTFDRIEDVGLDDPAAAIGQEVKQYVAVDGMLRVSDLKPVDLVKRGRPVSITGGSGGVVAQIAGSALDSGSYGDSVRVRLGNTRNDRREVHATVTGIGTVRLAAP